MKRGIAVAASSKKAYGHFILGLLVLAGSHCTGQKNRATGAYDFNHPDVIINLPKNVSQISGIAYSNDNSVYAVDDDHGNIYKIPLTPKPAVESWNFGKPDDYEDLVLQDNIFYILSSKGAITRFPASFPVKDVQTFALPLKGKNEFEILYSDPSSQSLLMVCKDCKEDQKDETSAFRFILDKHTFENEPAYMLQKSAIEKKAGHAISRFKPSAAAVHPVTGEVYIVSSINKIIVVLDESKKVAAVYPLPAKLFKQPEGIAFSPAGDMIISNEFAHQGSATLLLFRKK